MNYKKDWIEILSALLTPTIAVVGIVFTWLTYRLGARKRKDELFDRRYDFYKKVEQRWRSTGIGSEPNQYPKWEWDDIEPWAHEATFLFGSDIAKHLRSYADKGFEGVPWVPDDKFSKPFEKYLKF
jgi:hypothetical protein